MPTNPTYIQSFVEIANDEDEWEHGGNGEDILQSLEIGDNFVVDATLGNEEDCEFYVTYCKKLIFEVSADGLNNDWGNSFELGYIVIGGRYYQRWDYEQQNGTMPFVSLQDQGLVFFFFGHLVRASNFVMLVAHQHVACNTLLYCMFSQTMMLICVSLSNSKDDY